MRVDTTVKALLILILLALVANLLRPSFLQKESLAETEEAQDLSLNAWREGAESAAISVVCSSDGKYVFVTDGGYVYRSTNFGKVGSWERVLR